MRQCAYGRLWRPVKIACKLGWRRCQMTTTGLAAWYGYLKSHERAGLHPDAVGKSPVVHTPQRGRDITFKYLSSAEKVLGGPGFKYVGEWLNPTSAVLEFENEIEGIKLD